MRALYTLVTVAAMSTAALAPAMARAAPSAGAPLPPFRVADLAGGVHQSDEVRRPTLFVVCTAPAARDATSRWLDAAHARYRGRDVRVVTLVALSLPSLVPTGLVFHRARPQTPRASWADTWLDTHSRVQRALGVNDSATPYVFAVDAQGRVRDAAHAPAGSPVAARVLAAL